MPLVGVVVVLALIFFAYLTAVASPEENLKNLPMALVNEDRGAEVAGTEVRIGDGMADKVTGPDSPSGTRSRGPGPLIAGRRSRASAATSTTAPS